ncbi:LysR family transcriptional regulator [Acetobacterium paludosum]|nr:LysR family transcriptional regulator [Acetobacterium paludosum]
MLKQIRYFQSVVRNQSFTEAAEECFISQSAISQQIQALENELGVQLIVREKRKFFLTPAGEHFYQKSSVILSEFEALCRETMRIGHNEQAELRIGYLKSYGGNEIQLAVIDFSAKYLDVAVQIITGNHEDLYDHLRLGKLDLVLNDQRRAFSDEYVNLLLTESCCHIEIASRNPIADFEWVTTEQLRKISCILVASQNQWETEQTYYRDIVGFKGDFLFFDNLEEARLMVVGGKGFMPIEGGERPSQFGTTISRVPLYKRGSPVHRRYCAFWKVNNSVSKLKEFSEILKSKFNKGN